MASRTAALIVNPVAGRGRAGRLWRAIAREFDAGGVRVCSALTRCPGHATLLAEAAARSGYDLVIAVGGDGTAHEVANGLLQVPAAPPLAPVQTGTGNALSRVLGLPRHPLPQARALLQADEVLMDVGWADFEGASGRERRAFLLLGSAGWSASVVGRARNYHHAGHTLRHVAAMAYEWWEAEAVEASLCIDEQPDRRAVTDLSFVNAPVGFGSAMLAPGADPMDGLMEALVVGALSRREFARVLAGMRDGSHVCRPGVSYGRARRVELESDARMAVQLDGELVGHTPVTFTVQPAALRVLVNADRCTAIRT